MPAAAERAELVRRALDMQKHGDHVTYGGPNLFNWCLDNGIPCILQEPLPVDPSVRVYR